jgi:hypothetical protein
MATRNAYHRGKLESMCLSEYMARGIAHHRVHLLTWAVETNVQQLPQEVLVSR